MRWFIIFAALVIAVGLWLSFGVMTNSSDLTLDAVEVNNIAKQIEETWPDALSGILPKTELDIVFVEEGHPISAYIANRDTMVDVIVNSGLVGKLVVLNDSGKRLDEARVRLTVTFFAAFFLVAAACAAFAFYQYKTILQPFQKLESFAARVAMGDLTIPLEMDRKNRFGAFSESFDLMREQLAAARESERMANISKKELVASLSHDIKTPVASIKAVAELMQVKNGESSELATIIKKADHIDLLISNMFSATLEELRQLKVAPSEIPSTVLAEIIHTADYEKKVRPFRIPECIISADKLRLRQVIDNIIGNSYKYADTDIEVAANFENGYLVLSVRDFGAGVPDNELPLLCEKFYRSKNSEGKSGSGLGLYISKYFLTEMDGKLEFENNDGFSAKIFLKI